MQEIGKRSVCYMHDQFTDKNIHNLMLIKKQQKTLNRATRMINSLM